MAVNWDRTPWNAAPGELPFDRYAEEYEGEPEDEQEEDFCSNCDGEGYIVDDCFEDSCCCADPETEHGVITCPTCQGKGHR
jgi:hypothetical protein